MLEMKKTGAVALIATVGALVLASTGFGESSSERPGAGDRANAAGLAEARANIAALRGLRAADADAIAPAVAQQPILADGVVDQSSSRLVRRVGRPVWLVNSSDGRSVCQVTAGALVCPPVSEIVERGLSPALVTRVGEPVHVSGVAADGVTTVDVVLGDGQVRTVEVSGNLFTLDVQDVPRAVRWVGPNGPESYQFPPVPGR